MKSSKFKFIFVLVSSVLVFTLISYTSGSTRKVTLFESLISSLTTLPQNGFTYLKSWVSKDTNFLVKLMSLRLKMMN